jgi:hypothetical protein
MPQKEKRSGVLRASNMLTPDTTPTGCPI